jgi:hypothetical protein
VDRWWTFNGGARAPVRVRRNRKRLADIPKKENEDLEALYWMRGRIRVVA